MGRCAACDKTLSESEMVAKITRSDGETVYRDTCSTCTRIFMVAAHGEFVEPDVEEVNRMIAEADALLIEAGGYIH